MEPSEHVTENSRWEGVFISMASRTPQLAMSPSHARGQRWIMAGVAAVGGARKLQRPLHCPASPFGARPAEGGAPTDVGDTGVPGQGVFPVSVHTCPALKARSPSQLRSLSPYLHYQSVLPAS
jgi:hypothetical protein